MLKGKRVLTQNYFGIILNDAEQAQVMIVHAIRQRNVDSWDSVVYGRQERVFWTATDKVVVIPWISAGHPHLCEKMPKWLHLRILNARPRRPRHHVTTIKGRKYIDW